VVAVGPREPEARHPDADDVGSERAERVVVEAEVRHHARAEVIDDDVRDGGEPAREVEPARVVEVQDDAPLAAHQRAGEAAATVAEVEAAPPLDLDDVRAEVGEDAGRDRTRDDPGEVEDARAVERPGHYTSLPHLEAHRYASRTWRLIDTPPAPGGS
jgi:hypothetical protein